MDESPRVFAGILHSGEASLGDAVASIRSQTLDSTYVIFGGLSDREGHGRLYSELSTADDCLFKVKIDADMVLASPRIFEAVAATFGNNPQLERVTLPLWDAISHRVIYGMHFWSPKVRWSRTVPMLHTDQVMSTARFTLVLNSVPHAAVHAPSHSPEELARYALRRLLFFLEYGTSTDAYWESVSAFVAAGDSEGATHRPERAIIAAAIAQLLVCLNQQDIMLIAEQPSSYLAVAETLAQSGHDSLTGVTIFAETQSLLEDIQFRQQALQRYAQLGLRIIRPEHVGCLQRIAFHLRNRGRIRSVRIDADELTEAYCSTLRTDTG